MKRLLLIILLLITLLFTGVFFGCNLKDDTFEEFSQVLSIDSENIIEANEHSFNYFILNYNATCEMACTIKYDIGGVEAEDNFWLEKGENMTFSSLILGYTDGKTANNLRDLTISPVKKKGTAEISNITIKMCRNLDNTEAYIQNKYIKLGIHLLWGGGISYYEDLKDNDKTLTNLLNCHDTGRLVQQSYYGTSSSPYQPGYYNGTLWSYNPVQGGNLYGEKSRLIDYKIENDSIYVKCLARDWAKQDIYSFCYYENKYILKEKYAEIYNRAFDFSGYTNNNSRDQELPAFYTISYLGTFQYYSGNDGWTNGELTKLENEGFWNTTSAYHALNSNETWCAWTDENNFGIGVFSPTAKTLLAGRFQYDGSKSGYENGTNYVAPLVQTSFYSLKEYEYTYFITSGNINDIRNTFYQIQKSYL